MSTNKLSEQLTSEVLTFLAVKVPTPTLPTLEKLLAAYYCPVPWESVFRIVRGAETAVPSPRWPNQFWQEAMTRGSGGTCFESNYAFFALLQTLGYEGCPTMNKWFQRKKKKKKIQPTPSKRHKKFPGNFQMSNNLVNSFRGNIKSPQIHHFITIGKKR